MTHQRPKLNAIEKDFLTELFNLGVGQAAAALSIIVKQEIMLSVPHIEIQSIENVAEVIGDNRPIASVIQTIGGPFSGWSMLLFPQSGSLEVVRGMLGNSFSDEMLAELQPEAFTEIGNIVLNACIGAIAKSTDMAFELSLPNFKMANINKLLMETVGFQHNSVLLASIDMRLKSSDVTGYLTFLLSIESYAVLQQYMRKTLGDLRMKLVNDG